MLYYENYDLTSIVTPVDAEKFGELLEESFYDPSETEFIVQGFKEGFPIGYRSKHKVQLKSNNLKLQKDVGDEIDLWNKFMKEVKLKRYAGPFEAIPTEFEDDFIQSPIGLVPKDHGKDARLIFHLSHPRKPKGSEKSVNSSTPPELCSVSYPDFADAVKLMLDCILAGNSCVVGKSDAKSAFRNLGILKQHWRYLIMKARSPLNHKWFYFIDKCLPFGASISCVHFHRVSNAIAHIVQYKTCKPLVNYLDDYLFVAVLKSLCNAQMNIFLEVCQQIRMPIALEKTFWASDSLTFLRFLIDTIKCIISLLTEKITKARNMIQTITDKMVKLKSKWKITILQLEKICGFLNFLSRAIIPGHTFTRCLYSNLKGHDRLAPHHHIRVTDEMMLDLQM